MTDDLVGRLQERMAAASEQPWIYRPDQYDDWGFIRGVQRDDRGIGPFRPIVAIARDSTVRTQQENEHREAGTDPYGPNALLIVEAVNALPTLLARIEALEAEKALFRQVFQHLDRCRRDAPGHNHDVAGVWDNDPSNGLEAGTLCEWCSLWSEVRAVLTPEAPHAD